MTTKKIMDSPRSFVADAARAAAARAADLRWVPNPGFFVRHTPTPHGQVALISGGGSGHEPLHAGFVGEGMLAGACPGLIFTSPNALQIRAATAAVNAGGGVLHIVKNYTGDVVNFSIAADFAADDGIDVETVIVADDVATESDDGPGRRGTAATIAVEKVCGAAAARGDTLAEVARWGRTVAENSRSMAAAFRACTVPGADGPSFELGDDEVEIGVGIHGERGTGRVSTPSASELAATLIDPVLDSLGVADGAEVIVIVNGLGATHPLELDVLFGDTADYLHSKGIRVRRALVGTFVTAYDMAGASITVVVCTEEMLKLWDAPTAAPGWPNSPAGDFAGMPDATEDVAALDYSDDTPPEAHVTAWASAFTGRVLDRIDELTELDRRAGDGDFGANMRAALDEVAISDTDSPSAVFRRIADGFLGSAGGTSGALFGVWFHQFDVALSTAGVTTDALADAARDGMRAIVDLGGAAPGDKTMIDAIEPAARALDSARGRSPAEALRLAADAARDGAESTADLVGRRGRASYIGDAARGVTDPGALVVAWLFEDGASCFEQ
ncbi:dihydroxyacetone kinase [Rhodococcus sp. Leaf7]|uniref:dihydroxyacetone kinase family protein n=1 Tax=unclassified Rhodococcus (in: high G+C Gram-positive bacteria) TaxID=192944 RepID=UPI0006FCBB4C|nr:MULTISPECIES: dihydroxyacetone kinase family protein [unclassified Rhodococcus (in: high G+C Gram-positive bacteria)]KQU04681.1 dihydroxyacetone kinase [Rhodococcus sp. Leaf7]KQU40867.1 dihydroxyacetone kinase [Rhodococcus sp. Leaf247]